MARQLGEKVPEYTEICADTKQEGIGIDRFKILEWIRENEIGGNAVIDTPFGQRRVVYCDYAASGRAVLGIEKYIVDEVLPLYGNTHSSVTTTSEQSTLFLHEARDVIRNAIGAGEHDAVLFTGNGTTAAVELLVYLLGLQEAVIVTSIQEHHSNMLPWRESFKEIFVVPETPLGLVDTRELEKLLEEIRRSKGYDIPILGCFTAASNITGILSDVNAVNGILKRWNCISLWDYAAAAPYVQMDMNGGTPKDAIFFSGHKFIGGVQTPGVLILKKKLIKVNCPKRIGGGTVFFVSATSHTYLKEIEYREEGGTPDVVGAVRLALAFKLKATVGHKLISRREEEISRMVIERLSKNEDIVLLGPKCYRSRLAVFSFLVRDRRSSLFIHHNLVSALLNDLFGIQSRAGCACAGPYAQFLLGINEELALAYRNVLMEDSRLDRDHLRRKGEYSQREMLRPGFTRISIPYFASDEMVDFVISALEYIAKNATKFINQYQLNSESAEWHHHRQRVFHSRKWLGFVNFTQNGVLLSCPPQKSLAGISSAVVENDDLFAAADRFAENIRTSKIVVPDGRNVLDDETERLRWFVMGSEIRESQSDVQPHYPKCPFQPRQYNLTNIAETESKCSSSSFGFCSDDSVCNNFSSCEAADSTKSAKEESTSCCPLFIQSAAKRECVNGDGFGPTVIVDDGEEIDDWNKRIVVKSRENLSEEEMKRLPWAQPSLKLYREVTGAIHSLNMIREGDRILVCLSGGKDSLSLLHILHFYQQRAKLRRKTNFHLAAITVDPGSAAFNPRPLIDYCKALNIDYFYEEQNIIEQATRLPKCRSICSFCSRMKRGRLVAAAKQHDYNVLAMAHHLDDLAESFLIAAFQNGNLSTIKAQYVTRDAGIRIIRPLIYVREKSLREFAESNSLPVIAENCPACFEQPKERYRMKQMLASHELIFPQLFSSLKSALHPLLLIDSPITSGMRRSAIENIVKENEEREKLVKNDDEDEEDDL